MRKVTITHPSGESRQGYEAAPGLAVAKGYRSWAIYHLPSGYGVPYAEHGYDRRRDAAFVAERIADATDWTQTAEQMRESMTEEEGKRVRDAIRDANLRLRTRNELERGWTLAGQGLRRMADRGHTPLLRDSRVTDMAPVAACEACGTTIRVSYDYKHGQHTNIEWWGDALEADCPDPGVSADA